MTATAIGSYATTAALKTLIGTTDSNDDTLIGLICDRVNQFIESTTKQPLSPISSATYLYDGNGLSRIWTVMPEGAATLGIGGLRAITTLEIASETNGTFTTATSTDYLLRGKHGVAGPYRWVALSDRATGLYSTFPVGRGNIRITATAGWAAIPDDVTAMALNLAHRMWNARQSGNQNIVVTDELGQNTVAQYADPMDKMTLKRYMARPY